MVVIDGKIYDIPFEHDDITWGGDRNDMTNITDPSYEYSGIGEDCNFAYHHPQNDNICPDMPMGFNSANKDIREFTPTKNFTIFTISEGNLKIYLKNYQVMNTSSVLPGETIWYEFRENTDVYIHLTIRYDIYDLDNNEDVPLYSFYGRYDDNDSERYKFNITEPTTTPTLTVDPENTTLTGDINGNEMVLHKGTRYRIRIMVSFTLYGIPSELMNEENGDLMCILNFSLDKIALFAREKFL